MFDRLKAAVFDRLKAAVFDRPKAAVFGSRLLSSDRYSCSG